MSFHPHTQPALAAAGSSAVSGGAPPAARAAVGSQRDELQVVTAREAEPQGQY